MHSLPGLSRYDLRQFEIIIELLPRISHFDRWVRLSDALRKYVINRLGVLSHLVNTGALSEIAARCTWQLDRLAYLSP